MRSTNSVSVSDVAAFYSGLDVDVLELVMGEQVHVGGLDATLDLARRAGIGANQVGVDLCCCNGAGMRALVRFCEVSAMTGVDISAHVIERGRFRCQRDGLADRIRFVEGDARRSGLKANSADFVWSEDAWVYVPDKGAIVAEAARIVRPGGVVAFSDWVEGSTPLTDDEAEQLMGALRFPSLETIDGYAALLADNGLDVAEAADTQAFADQMDLYTRTVRTQLKYDVLRVLGFDHEAWEATALGFAWLAELGRADKLVQARFVATST